MAENLGKNAQNVVVPCMAVITNVNQNTWIKKEKRKNDQGLQGVERGGKVSVRYLPKL